MYGRYPAGRISATLTGMAVLISLALASPGNAVTATASMPVTATVQATCTISVTPMAFGTYSGALLNSTATITTQCTNTTPYTIGLSAGLATGATVANRSMTAAAVKLNYGLFQNATFTTNWGNTPGTDTPASANGTGAAVNVTVYGQVGAGQFVAPGPYTDTITATVNF